MFEKLFRKQTKIDHRLELIHTDKHGNKYYKFKDPRQLPGARLRAAEMAAIEAELCITSQEGSRLLEIQMDYMNKGDFVHASSITVELYNRFKSLAEEETLLKLASVYVVMEGEPVDEYMQSWFERKLKAWADDEQAKGFFLGLAIQITEAYGDTSPQHILEYLKNHREELEKSKRYIARLLSKTTSITSTKSTG